MKEILRDCVLCPRNCHANRLEGEKGYCGVTAEIKVARASLHVWEEPCISGKRGSGTVFFTGCALGCVYCQNRSISKEMFGKEISVDRLSQIFLELEKKGAHNINLVTPSHFSLQIIKGIKIARSKGLHIPIVYNCSGYEKVDTLRLLEGYVDVYLTDFKYMDRALAKKYSNVGNYFEYASKAVNEMFRQTGDPEFDLEGMMTSGVVIRHLMLPGCLKDSKSIIKYLYDTYGDQVYLSIMNQYTPIGVEKYPELNRKITSEEYDELVQYAISLGIKNAFIQEGDAAQESFIPSFDCFGV